jgi:hypothetical protein
MNKLIANTLITVGFAAAVVAPVGAQTATPSAPDGGQASHGARMHHVMRGHDEKRPFSQPTERVEARLAYIKTALKITDAQQPQWDAFANWMRKQATEREKWMGEWHARMAQSSKQREHRGPTAIERMEREQQFHAAAITRLNELLEVERPLYAALTSEQKQVADELLVSHGHRGGSGQGMQHGNRRWGA